MNPAKIQSRTIPIQKRHRRLKLVPADVRAALRELDRSGFFPCPAGELSLVFMDDAEIARLHEEFFGDPSPTDVITFEGDPAMNFAGEICVSADHALRYAEQHGVDFSRELTLYLVHGYLHLAGFDDTGPADRRRMRAAEKKSLALLESSGLLPLFHVVT